MGSARKQNKSFRTRATRSSGRSNLLTSDPLQNTVQLNNQLRSLGLYAAPTIGDGNCLFRALSDQHYGSPSRHVEVRREICDFIEAHPERYEGFEKGSGLSAYVAGMRQNATYGGHMELSAFAHLTKRNIKVVQPGLVYVIQCDPAQPKSPKPASKKAGDSPSKYTRSGSSRELDGDGDSPMSPGEGQDSTIYVAYHDWEHFSSVRNLRGPHTGIPQVCEMAPPPSAGSSSSASPPPEERLPPSKARKKERERKEKEKKEAGRLKAKEKATPHTAHGSVDKPKSRVMDSQASASSSTQQTTGFKLKIPPSTPVYFSTNPSAVAIDPLSNLSHLTHLIPPPRIQRSPKRSFEESVSEEGSAESGISTSSAESKRSRIEDEDASEYRGRQGHRNEQMEDSPEPVENGVLPSLKEDEPESTDADDGHHSKADGLMGKSQDSLPDAPASMLSARGSESPHESNDEDDDDDDEYVDEEDANNDDDDDDEDYLEPHVRSVVPPKMARNRHVGTMSERPLTRRQRKKLGLPKPRNIPVSGKGVGKIVIPGGKSTNSLSRDTSSTAEWTANGNGRVDVRGFRELKI
ncbi:hypothetical protein EV368DRAFT_75392 [Lentinula lateritia]|nr:hypothetical protein EV368DRAFT_75392 [Lentinula lateritia]